MRIVFPKFEFGHFYKFAVSLGLILIAFGAGLPWLILRDISTLTISEKSVAEMTPTARRVLTKKQGHQLWVVDHYPSVAVTSTLSGLLILGYGSYKWWRRQGVLDETEDVQRDTAKVQLRQMTPADVELKQQAEAEAEAEVAEVAATSEVVSDNEGQMAGRAANRRRWIRSAVRDVDARLAFSFAEAFRGTHEVRPNVILDVAGTTIELDLLLISHSAESPTYIADFKYYSSSHDLADRILDSVWRLALRTASVSRFLGESVTAVLVIVFDENVDLSSTGLIALRDRVRASSGPIRTRLLIISRTDLTDLSSAHLRSAVESDEVLLDAPVRAL